MILGVVAMKKRENALGDRNLIGLRVSQLRKEHKMTQKELMSRMQAAGVDINYSSLSKLEGQTRIATDIELTALAKIFRTTPNDLLGFGG